MTAFPQRAASVRLLIALLSCSALAAAADEPSYNARSLSFGSSDGSTVGEAFNALDQVAGSALTADFQAYHAFFHDGVTLHDIGTLGGNDSIALAFNDAGQVVGESSAAPDFEQHAFLWTRSTGIVDLGTLGLNSIAIDVNNHGQVVGGSVLADAGDGRAFSWTQAGGMVNLGTLGGHSTAIAINDAGQILGSFVSDDTTLDVHVFFWTEDEGMRDIGTLGGSGAYAILLTEAGQVVGTSTTDAGASHAFSWTAATGMIDLGTFGGSDSFPVAVNEAGQVVGWAHDDDGSVAAFSWAPDTGLVRLSLGGTFSQATAVNAEGQVVGYANLPGDEVFHAFSWTLEDGIVDLGTLGGGYSYAASVNDAGQVVGWATDADEIQRAILWTARDGMLDLNHHVRGGPVGSVLSDAVVVSTNGSIVVNSSSYPFSTGQYLLQPTTGDVTGGGWLDSPAGAYPSGPTVAGRATFGFVARYNNGHGGAPSGHVEFKLGAARLNFRSDNFEWLVVAGARAKIKGTGFVNGSAGYEFMVTAIDGARTAGGGSDRFRMKIWRYDPVLQHDVVIYDNQIDPATDGTLNEGTPIGGGNIAIHP